MDNNSEVKSFTFFVSYYKASKFMSNGERTEFFKVILEYAFENKEPNCESADPVVMAAFTLVRPNIENSLKNSRNGAKGGSARKADSRSDVARKHAYKPASKPASGSTKSDKDKDWEKDRETDREGDKEACEDEDKCGCEPREGPPTLESVAAYVKEEGLAINADAFFNYYAARGWMLGGTPVADWKALARSWQSKEGKFCRAQRGEVKVDEGIYSVFD